MLPFYTYCEQHAARLYQLKDGRFQIIDSGPITPLMCGPGYVLLENHLAAFLQEQEIERVAFQPAVIWNRRENIEFQTHQFMAVNHYFSSNQIRDLNLLGERFLTMGDEYLFVTPALKERLEKSPFNFLRFSEGLSEFVGSNT